MWKNLCPTYVSRRKNVGLLSDLEEVRHGMYREASFREEDGLGMRSSSCRQSESSAQQPKSCTRSRGFSSGMASSCLRKEYSSQSVSWLLLGISSGGRRFTFELRSSGDRAHLVLWGHWELWPVLLRNCWPETATVPSTWLLHGSVSCMMNQSESAEGSQRE